jgi:hydroxymethylglutaryl-CoA lyase
VERSVSELPARVAIREVGPRDGLQSEKPLPTEDRARLITHLSRTGIPKIEAVSFVSPKVVPAMANAADVWAQVERQPEVAYSALVPNRRGAEAAVEAGGFSSLQAFLAASDGYNRHNVGKSVQDSMRDVADVVRVAEAEGISVEASISASFGDPYEGDVAPERVLEVGQRLLDAGVSGLSLADTTGMATPSRVWTVLGLLLDKLPEFPLSLHLHDTRGTAMANVLAALELGITEFDASVGGLGGSPFAPGANGNVATEDVVHMLMDMGIETGVKSLEGLLEVTGFVERLVGHELRSQVAKAGPRWSVAVPLEPKS